MLIDPSGLGGQCGGGGGVVLDCKPQLPDGTCWDCIVWDRADPSDKAWRSCQANNAAMRQCQLDYYGERGLPVPNPFRWGQIPKPTSNPLDWIPIDIPAISEDIQNANDAGNHCLPVSGCG